MNPVTFFEMVAAQDGLQLPSHERQREAHAAGRGCDAPAEDVTSTETPTSSPIVHPDQSLETALRLFGRRRTLAVVSRRDLTSVVGTLALDDVLKAYGVKSAP